MVTSLIRFQHVKLYVCMHEIVIAVIHLETNHVIKQYPWCNGRWERTIVSACIIACDQFTFINGYLLHPKMDKSLEILAVTTGFISYIQIKSRWLMGEKNNSYKMI